MLGWWLPPSSSFSWPLLWPSSTAALLTTRISLINSFSLSSAWGSSSHNGFSSASHSLSDHQSVLVSALSDWAVLRFGESDNDIYSPTYPLLTFAAYQGTFAIITPALISGAIVGRMKLIPYMIFIFIWTTVCYDPMAHWVWGNNGWLKHLGTLDFAGGTVVHILSGVSGFVASIILGKRHDYDPRSTAAHNLPFTVLGTSLLWVGWSGFNGGSANGARWADNLDRMRSAGEMKVLPGRVQPSLLLFFFVVV